MAVLVDTGPLVALLNARDACHRWTVGQFGQLAPPLFSCEAVLAEAHHLLAGVRDGGRRLCQLVETGRLDLSFSYADHTDRVHHLIGRYADQPMSFADACLVVLAEVVSEPRVLTLDEHFAIYRMHRNRRIPLSTPIA